MNAEMFVLRASAKFECVAPNIIGREAIHGSPAASSKSMSSVSPTSQISSPPPLHSVFHLAIRDASHSGRGMAVSQCRSVAGCGMAVDTGSFAVILSPSGLVIRSW